VPGFAVGDSEDGAFRTTFLRSLEARPWLAPQLAIATVLLGAGWQRCGVHFMPDVRARVSTGNAEKVTAAIGTISACSTPSPRVLAMQREAHDNRWPSPSSRRALASSPTPELCCGWPARSWSWPTTTGRSPSAATSPRARWPPSHPHGEAYHLHQSAGRHPAGRGKGSAG
jgi:hypothetical protein